LLPFPNSRHHPDEEGDPDDDGGEKNQTSEARGRGVSVQGMMGAGCRLGEIGRPVHGCTLAGGFGIGE
jgi:hypothetical protein